MTTDAEILAIVGAHMRGAQIQTKCKFHDSEWQDIENPEWQFGQNEYRIKPEPRKPRELTLVYKGNGTWKEWMAGPGPCLEKAIRVREVLGDEH